MGEKPSSDRKPEPNLELPQLRLPGLRRRKVRRSEPTVQAAPAEDREPVATEPEPDSEPAEAAGPHRGRAVRARARRLRRRPALPGPAAAALAGIVVGAAGTGATYGGLRGCEAVNGTPSCGAPGLGYLVAIAIGMVAVGALLLRALRAPEPIGTSLLGVGIVLVVVLLALTPVIFSGWMFLAIPLLTGAAYTLAHWVSTRFVEPVEPPPGPDVR